MEKARLGPEVLAVGRSLGSGVAGNRDLLELSMITKAGIAPAVMI